MIIRINLFNAFAIPCIKRRSKANRLNHLSFANFPHLDYLMCYEVNSMLAQCIEQRLKPYLLKQIPTSFIKQLQLPKTHQILLFHFNVLYLRTSTIPTVWMGCSIRIYLRYSNNTSFAVFGYHVGFTAAWAVMRPGENDSGYEDYGTIVNEN